jgi:uncharacterized protein (DUF427 family)
MWNYSEPLEGCVDVSAYVAFYWNKVDTWLEEEDEVFVHAKDPYRRIDCLHSARHVVVVVDGVTLADTERPVMLVETGLPARYYIPKNDVPQELLRESEKSDRNPYKGEAHYYSVQVGDELVENLAWSYRYPLAEASKIAGYLCFPQGKVELYVDGELQEKPRTRWD